MCNYVHSPHNNNVIMLALVVYAAAMCSMFVFAPGILLYTNMYVYSMYPYW